MSSMAKVFELDRRALNASRAVVVVVVLVPVVIVLEVLDLPHYVTTVVFAVMYVGLSDPGGEFGSSRGPDGRVRADRCVLTLLGFAIGPGAWELVVVAAFAVTLASGLAIKFGRAQVRRGAAAQLLVSDRDLSGARIRTGGRRDERVDRRRWPGSRGRRLDRVLRRCVVGARTEIAPRAGPRDPGGRFAEEADAADDPVRADPRDRDRDRRRDPVRTRPARSRLDADRHACRDEARP